MKNEGATAQAGRIPFIAALGALLLFGTIVRASGVLDGTLDLWADEAWWATILAEEPLKFFSIRPIGYMWLCKQLAPLGDAEVMLRLPSLVAGIGTLFCLAASGALLFKERPVVLTLVFLAALNPKLIVYAKEFKPYSLEIFVHAALLYWALICSRKGHASTSFWAACAAAILFCYNAVFLFPAFLVVLTPGFLKRAWDALLRRLRDLHLASRAVLLVGLVVALLLFNDALLDWTGIGRQREFWGDKYGVFPNGRGFWGSLVWYCIGTWDLITFAGLLPGIGRMAQPGVQLFLFVSYALGITSLVRSRRYAELALLTGPILTAAVANLLGYWPYGAFRTNLFLLPGILLVVGFGLEWVSATQRTRLPAYGAMLLVAAVSLPTDLEHFRTKSSADWAPSPQLTKVLDDIQSRLADDRSFTQNVILTDWHSWRPLAYYLETDPRGRLVYSDVRDNSHLIKGPLNDLSALQLLLEHEHLAAVERGDGSTRLWIVVTKLSPYSAIRSDPLVKQFGTHTREFTSNDKDYHPLLIELRF